MYAYLLILSLIAIYMIGRGYRLARASGYRHYFWLDGILGTLVLSLLALPFSPGSVEARTCLILFVVGWTGVRAIRINWERRQEKVDPIRWQRWEQALQWTSSLNRWLLRFPIQLYPVDPSPNLPVPRSPSNE